MDLWSEESLADRPNNAPLFYGLISELEILAPARLTETVISAAIRSAVASFPMIPVIVCILDSCTVYTERQSLKRRASAAA
jgi:hypothetical protein